MEDDLVEFISHFICAPERKMNEFEIFAFLHEESTNETTSFCDCKEKNVSWGGLSLIKIPENRQRYKNGNSVETIDVQTEIKTFKNFTFLRG